MIGVMAPAQVRQRILASVSANGGHLASSLGAVEIACALAEAYDPECDRIIWDVGHQAYAWKILTGRADVFSTLRKHGGVAPFASPDESAADAFISGHAGVALAAALGLSAGAAVSRPNGGGGPNVVAVVGDASLLNGESMEALAMIARRQHKVTIVFNDNRDSASCRMPKLNETFFAAFGVQYIGPVDGHDVRALSAAFGDAKARNQSVVVHAVTQKGKGFEPAEDDPEGWHCVGPFDVAGAKPGENDLGRTWSDAFGEIMVSAARQNDKVCAVVAAMRHGTGLDAFAKEFPDRFFDVGICESMAVTFAAGLAKAGMRPVVAIYSTFLQRAVDQIQHDVCLQKLPVVFAIDRAGCVGADGPTHHGLLDISLLRPLTGMKIVAPTGVEELHRFLNEALSSQGPTAIRYPKGIAPCGIDVEGPSAATRLLAVGDQVAKAVKVRDLLAVKGIDAQVVPVSSVKPASFCKEAGTFTVTLENGSVVGGFGEGIGADMVFGWPDAVVGHGTVEELEREFGFDAESIAEAIWRNNMA